MPRSNIAPASHRSGWADFIAGLGYVRQHPKVGVLTLVKAMGQIGSIDVIAAIYAERVFHFGQDGAATLGAMLAGFGVGAVAGPLVGNLFHDHSTRMLKRAIIGGYVAIVIAWVILGVSPTLPLVLIGCVLRGMGGSLNWTYSDVLLQMAVPNHFLGRVYSLDFGLFTLAMSVSVWLTGLALDQYIADPRFLAIVLAAIAIGPVIIWGTTVRLQASEAPV